MLVYLDESGDTGWQFSFPFRAGGSSRFLCLAFMFIPHALRHLPKQVILEMYRKYGWLAEKKAASANATQKTEFANAANFMLGRNDKIKVDCIVVKKENVQPHIRADGNKLYNYMCKLVMCDHLEGVRELHFIPDKRSIKVKSGNSLADYLQTTFWFECKTNTTLNNDPQESHRNYNLQFVDWVAHLVWAHFEDGENDAFRVLCPHLKVRLLFF